MKRWNFATYAISWLPPKKRTFIALQNVCTSHNRRYPDGFAILKPS